MNVFEWNNRRPLSFSWWLYSKKHNSIFKHTCCWNIFVKDNDHFNIVHIWYGYSLPRNARCQSISRHSVDVNTKVLVRTRRGIMNYYIKSLFSYYDKNIKYDLKRTARDNCNSFAPKCYNTLCMPVFTQQRFVCLTDKNWWFIEWV